MKIALIGRYGDGEIVAGPERVARELFRDLKNKNHQVVFIEYFFSGYKNSSLYKKLFGSEISNNSVYTLGVVPLIRMLLKERFAIVHIINSQRFVLVLFLVRWMIKWKLVATLHGFMRYEIPEGKFWNNKYFIDLLVEKFILFKCDLIVFPSNLLCETFTNYYKISKDIYKIIPNGVSKIYFGNPAFIPKIEHSIKLVFYNGFTGAINKGIDELLMLLSNINFKIELYILGKRSEFKACNNVEVNFVGVMDHPDLINLYRDKHFVIKSPAFEPFSIFVAECMSVGLIPILNENVGISDFIEHEVNGFIYLCKSQNSLTELFNNILSNKYDLDLISTNAKKIHEQLNWKSVTSKYISEYEVVV